jgi:truncated hemoglobin YjbI/plastocyanin
MKISGIVAFLLLAGCGGSHKDTAPTPTTAISAPPATTQAPPADQTPEPTSAPSAKKSLYERLGGMPGITALIIEFGGRTRSDPRIKDRFFNTDAANLRRLVIEFFCVATGGPCQYTGRTMETTHERMDLVDDEYDAFIEDLVGALDKLTVPDQDKAELLGLMEPLKPEMIAPPDKLRPIDQKKLDAASKLAGKLKDKAAAELLATAVVAGQRGQRLYAEQLFTRAEMIAGPKALATVASTFREGAPPSVTAKPTKMQDKGAQPAVVGKTDEDEAPRPKAKTLGSLHGVIKIDGKAPDGLGVVMLWPEKGGARRTPKQRVIEQRNKAFAPHVMAIPVGSTVTFPNFDSVFHNVFSLSKVKPFELGMYRSGETREVKFDKPGIVRLGCNLHANMSAYLIVVDAPHYVVVDNDGSFAFKALAAGKYKVQAWNEHSDEPLTTTVDIKAGDNSSTLDLKAGGGGISPDKFGTPRQQLAPAK